MTEVVGSFVLDVLQTWEYDDDDDDDDGSFVLGIGLFIYCETAYVCVSLPVVGHDASPPPSHTPMPAEPCWIFFFACSSAFVLDPA